MLLYLKTHLLVWSRLFNVVTGGGCFLPGKEERSKNEELNVTGICNRRMKRNKKNKCSPS